MHSTMDSMGWMGRKARMCKMNKDDATVRTGITLDALNEYVSDISDSVVVDKRVKLKLRIAWVALALQDFIVDWKTMICI